MKEQDQLISLQPVSSEKRYLQITGQSQVTHEDYQLQMKSLQLHSQDLMDLMGDDGPMNTQMKSNNYVQFLRDRQIEVQKPQLVKQGYLISYKLYKIKSKKKEKEQFETSVNRRFNDFQFLHYQIVENYGGYVLPRLPSKNFLANLNLQTVQFQQIRTKELHDYLSKLLNHPVIRYSNELKHFLFDEDFNFSQSKGEFIEQSSAGDSVRNVTGTVYDFTRNIYQMLTGVRQTKAVDFSRDAAEEQELKLFEKEIEELQKVTQEVRNIIDSSFKEFSIIHDWTIDSNRSHLKSIELEQEYLRDYEKLIKEFEDISSFIENCHDALIRTKELRLEIDELENQQAAILANEKQNSRHRDLDLVRSKLQKANAKSEKWICSLKKELAVYTSEGKTLMEVFVKKYTKLRAEIYAQS